MSKTLGYVIAGLVLLYILMTRKTVLPVPVPVVPASPVNTALAQAQVGVAQAGQIVNQAGQIVSGVVQISGTISGISDSNQGSATAQPPASGDYYSYGD